jgi:hypothetical protein
VAFDLATAKPVRFDLASAKPVAGGEEDFANVQGGSSRQPQPVQEPTFMERHVAPMLEKVGGAVEAARPALSVAGKAFPAAQGAEFVLDNLHRNSPVVQGLADPGTAIAQLAANLVGQGDKVNPAVQAREREYQSARGADADSFDLTRVLTNVLNPLSLKGGSMIPAAASRTGRMAQGAGVGAAYSATQPVTSGDDFAGDKSLQALMGSLFGAAVPPVADIVKSVGKGTWNLISSALPSQAPKIAGRTANAAAGPRREAVISALENPTELVPGSAPHAGQAAVDAGSTEFAALGEVARRHKSSDFRDRGLAQQGARRAAIDSVAGTKDDLAAAESARTAASAPLYKAAREGAPVQVDDVVAEVDDLLARNPGNRELVTELANIRRGLVGEDGPRTDPEQVISVIDGIKASLANESNRFIGGTISGVRDNIKGAVPGLREADQAFADASVPVNQMRLGSFLRDKLLSPVDDETQRAGVFAQALRDGPRSIKKSTGQSRFESTDQVFAPEQELSIRGIMDDLARDREYANMAKQGAHAAGEVLGEAGPQKLGIPNLLSQPATIINAILRRVHGQATGKSMDELAQAYLDPKRLAELMRAATPSEQQQLIRAFGGSLVNPIGIGAPATAIGAEY